MARGSGGFIVGMLVGVAAGAITALMLAPMRGSETRQKVMDAYGSARDRVMGARDTAMQKAQELKGRAKEKREELRSRAKQTSDEMLRRAQERAEEARASSEPAI